MDNGAQRLGTVLLWFCIILGLCAGLGIGRLIGA